MNHPTRIIFLAFCSLALLLARGTAFAAPEATFTVDSTLDQLDADLLDGRCRTKAGTCTLRAAIMQANAFSNHDKIKLAPATYTLTRKGAEDNAQRGDLDIHHDLTISGAPLGTTRIDASGLGEHVFTIFENANVTLARLTIENGTGGIRNLGTLTLTRGVLRKNKTTSGGGGLLNGGTATVVSTTFHNNEAFQGGAIYNYGTLLVKHSTLSNNRAVGVPAGIQEPNGGGLFSFGDSTLFNTTVSNNRAHGSGGGIHNYGQDLRLEHVTVVLNRADQDRQYGGKGGGIRVEAGQVLVYNSILADNIRRGTLSPLFTKDDCQRAQQFQIYIYGSLVEAPGNCPAPAPINLTNVDPVLFALANNGGLTETHALASTSPAIELAASCAGGTEATRDQRNFTRPVDGNNDGILRCDAGSYEYGAGPP